VDVRDRRDAVSGHVVQEKTDALGGEAGALEDEGLLLASSTGWRSRAQVLGAEEGERGVFFEELREIKVLPGVVALLVEIHGADADLPVVPVGCELDDEIVAAHVAEEADEAALVELHEFLGDANGAELGALQPVVDEDIAREADDVFLDERVAVGDEVEAVGERRCSSSRP